MSKGSATYMTYNEGLEARHLHLGNLVHDVKVPNALDPYEEKAYADISEPAPAWARSMSLENFALTLGADDHPEAEDDDEETGKRYRVVAAAKTTRLEIRDPETFFTEVTLKSSAAQKWLAAHLSAAESLAGRPKIWMLTGLILMTHATWTRLSSTQAFRAGFPAPFDPTGVSKIRRSSVSEGVRPTVGFVGNEEANRVAGAVIHETGKYPGLRGWAAQWQKVEWQVLEGEKAKAEGRNRVVLARVDDSPPAVAVLTVDEEVYAGNGQDEDTEDDDYWEEFLDAVEEYD